MSGAPLRVQVRVTAVTDVTPLIKTFRLESLEGAPLPPFSGGAHLILEIPDGDVMRRNAYSLMGSPFDQSCYQISVRRDPLGRGGSRLIHEMVTPGTVLTVTHPANLFAIDRRGRKHVMVAGGIGITPFMAMAEQLRREAVPFELHYAVRSHEHGAYVHELQERFGDSVAVYVGERGERLPISSILPRQPLGTHLYVCGPSQLIDSTLEIAGERGWPKSAIHSERFTLPPSGLPFAVQLARSARTILVGSHQSMLDAIEAAGVDAQYLCRGGACGQCELRVLEHDGVLLHADHYLSDEAKASGATVMPCVSRFEGRRLLIDL